MVPTQISVCCWCGCAVLMAAPQRPLPQSLPPQGLDGSTTQASAPSQARPQVRVTWGHTPCVISGASALRAALAMVQDQACTIAIGYTLGEVCKLECRSCPPDSLACGSAVWTVVVETDMGNDLEFFNKNVFPSSLGKEELPIHKVGHLQTCELNRRWIMVATSVVAMLQPLVSLLVASFPTLWQCLSFLQTKEAMCPGRGAVAMLWAWSLTHLTIS